MSIKTLQFWGWFWIVFASGLVIGWVVGSQHEAERSRRDLIGINRQLDELLEYVLVELNPGRTPFLFASPDGVGDECTKLEPCAYETAMEKAENGQLIFFASGTYRDTSWDKSNCPNCRN